MNIIDVFRIEDESGVSGTGHVAEIVEFDNTGQCVMNWLTGLTSIGVYPDLDELIKIHGHNGKTVFQLRE